MTALRDIAEFRSTKFVPVVFLLVGAGCAVVSATAYGTPPATPKIEDSAGWQLSEGCRVYKFGKLTEPDCDILTGEGVAVQITRVRLLDLPQGQDNRPIIGIQLQPDHGRWYFSSPFVTLVIAGRSYTPAEIDQALVFARSDRPIFPEQLQPKQQRYELPPGEKRFFRLRFPVPQSELKNGFALRMTGLQKEGEALRVPIMRFE